jgi:uncharacterized protein YjbJ (UPF0337 family)
MTHSEDETEPVPESPATWENIVDGEVKEALGRVFGNKQLVEEGEEQVEIAHEVREEYEAEQDD